jgi:hypothetical protein
VFDVLKDSSMLEAYALYVLHCIAVHCTSVVALQQRSSIVHYVKHTSQRIRLQHAAVAASLSSSVVEVPFVQSSIDCSAVSIQVVSLVLSHITCSMRCASSYMSRTPLLAHETAVKGMLDLLRLVLLLSQLPARWAQSILNRDENHCSYVVTVQLSVRWF